MVLKVIVVVSLFLFIVILMLCVLNYYILRVFLDKRKVINIIIFLIKYSVF